MPVARLFFGRNYETVRIEGATEKQIIAARGFYPEAEAIPREPVLKKKASLLFRLAKGGHALVWLVLHPRASGWDVCCVPEPDNLHPGGTSVRFRGLLDQIARESQRGQSISIVGKALTR